MHVIALAFTQFLLLGLLLVIISYQHIASQVIETGLMTSIIALVITLSIAGLAVSVVVMTWLAQ